MPHAGHYRPRHVCRRHACNRGHSRKLLESLPPEQFLAWFAHNGGYIQKAIPPVVLPTLIGLASMIWIDRADPVNRLLWTSAAVCIAAVIFLTIGWFVPANTGFSTGSLLWIRYQGNSIPGFVFTISASHWPLPHRRSACGRATGREPHHAETDSSPCRSGGASDYRNLLAFYGHLRAFSVPGCCDRCQDNDPMGISFACPGTRRNRRFGRLSIARAAHRAAWA